MSSTNKTNYDSQIGSYTIDEIIDSANYILGRPQIFNEDCPIFSTFYEYVDPHELRINNEKTLRIEYPFFYSEDEAIDTTIDRIRHAFHNIASTIDSLLLFKKEAIKTKDYKIIRQSSVVSQELEHLAKRPISNRLEANQFIVDEGSMYKVTKNEIRKESNRELIALLELKVLNNIVLYEWE